MNGNHGHRKKESPAMTSRREHRTKSGGEIKAWETKECKGNYSDEEKEGEAEPRDDNRREPVITGRMVNCNQGQTQGDANYTPCSRQTV